MIIQAFNPSTDELEQSFLSSPVASGVSTLTVKNNQGFAGSQRILVGEMGTETAEIITVSGVSGSDTISLSSSTSFGHGVDTPVYILQFDQVKFYRATSLSGSYSAVATVTIDVDNDEKKTYYDDTTGLSSYYYKVSLYHSVSGVESTLSDPVKGSGYTAKQVGKLIDDVFIEFGERVENSTLTRGEIIAWMNEVHDDIHTYFKRPPEFLHTREAFTRTANRNYLDFPIDSNGDQKMWKFDRMDYNFTDTTTDPDTDETYTLRVISAEEFRNLYSDNTISSTTVDDKAQVMALDTALNRFRYYPPSETTSSNVFYLYYWKYFTVIDSEGDTVEMPGTKIYKEYIRAQYYYKLAKRETSYLQKADKCYQRYELEKFKLQRVNGKDAGSPRSFGFRGGEDFKGWRRY
jgi:hypothetical protein